MIILVPTMFQFNMIDTNMYNLIQQYYKFLLELNMNTTNNLFCQQNLTFAFYQIIFSFVLT